MYGFFVRRDKNHKAFWSSLADFAVFRPWFPLGEWRIHGSQEVFTVLSRVGLDSSWFPYFAQVPQRLTTAGSRVAARDLSVQLPFDLLFGDAPPPTSVRTWAQLVGWISQASIYASACRRQQDKTALSGSWWKSTWSVCPHSRVANLLPHPCQLCGDLKVGLGCRECHTHVCLPCHPLNESGWPANRRLAQRTTQRRNLSLRGMVQVREALKVATSGLDPREQGDVPRLS